MAVKCPNAHNVRVSVIGTRRPGTGTDHLTGPAIAPMQQIQHARNHHHVAEPGEEENRRCEERRTHGGGYRQNLRDTYSVPKVMS